MMRRTPPPLLNSILAVTAALEARRPALRAASEAEPSGRAVALALILALLCAAGAGLRLLQAG